MRYTRKEIKRAIDSYNQQGSTQFWTNEKSKKIIDIYYQMMEKEQHKKLSQHCLSETAIINMIHYSLNQ